MSKSDDPLEVLRVSSPRQRSILEQLAQVGGSPPGAEQRASTRHPYLVPKGLVLELSTSTARFLVTPRNLSTSGVGFLHGSYLHPGSPCTISLRTAEGEYVLTTGRITRCRHVGGRVHEVGMQFDSPIDVADFLPGRAAGQRPAEGEPPAQA